RHGHAARARSRVERPRLGVDRGTAAAARGGPHLVVRVRRPQRDARAGTRRVTGDVLVTGIGVLSAFGLGADAFWDGLLAGRDACVPAGIPEAPGARVARVEGLEARHWVRSAQGRRIDRTSL